MPEFRLEGMRVLVVEDEFLIAMDVEQLCRDHGASDVVIVRNLDELGPDALERQAFHAAILDVMLAGGSTLPFALRLRDRRIPFIFATGYAETEEIFDALEGVEVVSKPYAGQALIDAMGRAFARLEDASGGV